jgi:hypothetical protein
MSLNEILSTYIQKRVDTDMQLINCILQIWKHKK